MNAAKIMDSEPEYMPMVFRTYEAARMYREKRWNRVGKWEIGAEVKRVTIGNTARYHITFEGSVYCTDGQYH